MSEESTCNRQYDKCQHAKRIKLILQRHNKIISVKTQKSDNELEIEANELINNFKISNGQYSNIILLNDLYHLKYNHNINQDPNQFNLFYKYLNDKENTLNCDSSHCKAAERYYNRRNRTFNISQHNINNDTYSLHVLCRLHTYFMHSYEGDQLTQQEIEFVEQQLNQYKDDDHDVLNDRKLVIISNIVSNKKQNIPSTVVHNNKYITTDYECINFREISKSLKNKGINIDPNNLQNTFDSYGYHKQQLVDDLCNILLNGEDEGIVLSQIFLNALNYTNKAERQQIYNIIFDRYIKHKDLNIDNFIKILQMTASKIYPDINSDEIATIARYHNLNGNVFNKQSVHFKNSIKFGKIFNSMDNWDRKKWQKIYIKLNKWEITNTAQELLSNAPLKILQSQTDDLQETKVMTDNIDYIDKGTDIDLIEQFCTITNTTKNVAVSLLKATDWNVMFAINKYYASNGKISDDHVEDDEDEKIQYDHDDVDNEQTTAFVYDHGISFWYWNKQKSQKRFVSKTFDNLKEELLQFNQFTIKQWEGLVDECNILIKTDKIKKIQSNGNNADIYNIEKDSPITLQHIYSIKLYTDYTSLCQIFCKAFRLEKISENEYERVESVQCRNERVSNWARLLIESVQNFGKLRVTAKKYYRGISKQFIFRRFIIRFNVPLSTTLDFTKASEFAQGSHGLILELKRYNDFLPGLDCSKFSSFDQEKEVLFFGHNEILQISSIFQWFDNKWSSYRCYIQGIQSILNIANGSIKWNQKNNMKDIIGYILPDLYDYSNKLSPYIESLLIYHLQNVPNAIKYDFKELNMDTQHQWVQDIFVKCKNVPNVQNLCNLFKNCDNIVINMPSIGMMNAECCKLIVNDTLYIMNDKVCVTLKWSLSEPLQLIDIKGLLDKYSNEISTISLKTHIDEDNSNSIVIFPSKSKKYTMRLRLSAPIKVVESSTIIVSGFIHEVQKQYNFWYAISNDIFNICCIFYDCCWELADDQATPFTILFMIFDLQSSLSLEGWELLDNMKQCQYLQDHRIDTLDNRMSIASDLIENIYDFVNISVTTRSRIYDDIVTMLSKYDEQKETLSSSSMIEKWSSSDVITSFLSYLITTAEERVKQNIKTWEFVDYFRKYCEEMNYNGLSFETDRNNSNFGYECINNVCNKYVLNKAAFLSINEPLTSWSQFRNTTKRRKTDTMTSDSSAYPAFISVE